MAKWVLEGSDTYAKATEVINHYDANCKLELTEEVVSSKQAEG